MAALCTHPLYGGHALRSLAANRANAACSTGPSTPQGKARAAQNSRKHGFYQPVNSQELFSLAQQALLRAARLESGLFTTPVYPARNEPISMERLSRMIK